MGLVEWIWGVRGVCGGRGVGGVVVPVVCLGFLVEMRKFDPVSLIVVCVVIWCVADVGRDNHVYLVRNRSDQDHRHG